MSRYYQMSVEIEDFDPSKAAAIKEAATKEWPFVDWDENAKGGLSSKETGFLVGGEGEGEFANRLARAVMAANGAPCVIDVSALFLEDDDWLHFDENAMPEETKAAAS